MYNAFVLHLEKLDPKAAASSHIKAADAHRAAVDAHRAKAKEFTGEDKAAHNRAVSDHLDAAKAHDHAANQLTSFMFG